MWAFFRITPWILLDKFLNYVSNRIESAAQYMNVHTYAAYSGGQCSQYGLHIIDGQAATAASAARTDKRSL